MKNLIIIGAGGHSRPAIEIANLQRKWKNIELIDINYKGPESIMGSKIIGGLDKIPSLDNNKTDFFFAIGDNILRKSIFGKVQDLNINFTNLIHPKSEVSGFATIGVGNFIGPFSNIGPQVTIGNHNIINSFANIEHESSIGNYNHLGPSAIICGRSKIANKVFIGSNSTVIEKVSIPDGVIIGAGSVIINSNLEEEKKYAGIPIKRI
ncbi:acetyltransferase [Gammaproteobacteria bacterium]|nr:acetyltransferase [Gammaproteobacteria bacterium]